MNKIICTLALIITACSNGNVPDIKQNAEKVLNDAGFNIIGYEGYQYGSFGTYGGCVWYLLERNGITYDGCVSKWGDEYHIYNLSAKDAIKGN